MCTCTHAKKQYPNWDSTAGQSTVPVCNSLNPDICAIAKIRMDISKNDIMLVHRLYAGQHLRSRTRAFPITIMFAASDPLDPHVLQQHRPLQPTNQ